MLKKETEIVDSPHDSLLKVRVKVPKALEVFL